MNLIDHCFAGAVEMPHFILVDFFSVRLQSKYCLVITSLGL